MSRVLVDSNVLLDVLDEPGEWTAWAESALEAAARLARLVLNPVIFAEISVRYDRLEDLEADLPEAMFEREAIPYEAAFLAGKAFLEYRRRGGARTSPLPDFLIGAHAAVCGYRLLTRDAARYRTYFPRLDLITPA
jgi:predicted nucleic acid-binding protein